MLDRLALILSGAAPDQPSQLTPQEIAFHGARFRRRTAWLGAYADPREYAVELGLRVSCQPLSGSEHGVELVRDVLLYRGDADTRTWGTRVFLGLACAMLGYGAAASMVDRLRLVGQMALGGLIVGRALDAVLEEQRFCTKAIMRAYAAQLIGVVALDGAPRLEECRASSRLG